MLTTVLNGVPTWWTEHDSGDPVAALHPGGVDSRALDFTVAGQDAFRVLTPDGRGHGRTPDADGPLSYALMAENNAVFLENVMGGPTHVLGVSDGAAVALLLALHRPELVRRLVVVSGCSTGTAGTLPPRRRTAPRLGSWRSCTKRLRRMPPTHYPVVAAHLAAEHAWEPRLGPGGLGRVRARILVMVADDEGRLEHALTDYRFVPEAALTVVPGTSHGLLVEKPELCNRMIRSVLVADPVPTLALIRRALANP